MRSRLAVFKKLFVTSRHRHTLINLLTAAIRWKSVDKTTLKLREQTVNSHSIRLFQPTRPRLLFYATADQSALLLLFFYSTCARSEETKIILSTNL